MARQLQRLDYDIRTRSGNRCLRRLRNMLVTVRGMNLAWIVREFDKHFATVQERIRALGADCRCRRRTPASAPKRKTRVFRECAAAIQAPWPFAWTPNACRAFSFRRRTGSSRLQTPGRNNLAKRRLRPTNCKRPAEPLHGSQFRACERHVCATAPRRCWRI